MKSIRSFLAAAAVVLIHGVLANASLARTEIASAAQPQLAAGSDGHVWLAYGRAGEAVAAPAPAHGHGDGHGGPKKKEKGHHGGGRSGEVFVACSTDGGATFAPAVRAAQLPKLMLGNRRGPRIAVHGDRITVTAIGDELIAFASADGGKTWSQPVTINSVPTSAREGLHDLAAGPDGQLFVTWLDLRNGKTELWSATSKDGGRTWGRNEQVYRSPDKSICECCHPTALFDAEGNLAVMWRNSIEGSRDMWLMTRPKGTTQFTAARKLGEGTWKFNACPHDGELVPLGGGKFGAVWQRNGEVFLAGSEGAEVLLGKGRQPVAVRTRAGETFVVWQERAALMSARGAPGAEPTKCANDGRFPSIIALKNGKSVVLAYEDGITAKGMPMVTVERL